MTIDDLKADLDSLIAQIEMERDYWRGRQDAWQSIREIVDWSDTYDVRALERRARTIAYGQSETIINRQTCDLAIQSLRTVRDTIDLGIQNDIDADLIVAATTTAVARIVTSARKATRRLRQKHRIDFVTPGLVASG